MREVGPIVDAFHMFRTDRLDAKWKSHLIRNGIRMVEDQRTLVAYVNVGRWVADCPNCNGGIACANGEKGCCLDCGHLYSITFPSQKDIDAATTLLGERNRKNRHWFPDRETLLMLEQENELHLGNRAFEIMGKP